MVFVYVPLFVPPCDIQIENLKGGEEEERRSKKKKKGRKITGSVMKQYTTIATDEKA